MFIVNILLYIIAFVLIWFGSGLIVSSTTKFSSKLRLSSFAFSFVFLGLLTSTPEFSVGLQAVAGHDPEIFVGNLLGGVIVLFLVIIPILAIFGNGISLKNDIQGKILIATLIVIALPSFLILDNKVTNLEGVILVVSYLVLMFIIERKNGIFDRNNSQLLNFRAYSYKDLLKIILGVGLIFVSSHIIVDQTLFFANFFHVSAFYVSLIVVALGTDMPEISIAVRSVLSGKKDIAMGDYIGAAAASTLLFGVFTLLNNGEVLTVNSFYVTFAFISSALFIFYFISRSKNYISRTSGLILFGLYIISILVELSL